MNLNEKKSQQSSNKLNQLVNYISTLINDGKYDKALKEMEKFERRNPNDQNLKINKVGFLIDIGFNLNNLDLVKRGLKIGEETLNSQTANKDKASIYYNLANGYFSLFTLSESKSGIETIPQSRNLQKAKSCYRNAIELFDEYDFNLKKRLWVNYGNCLSVLGRKVEALYAFNNALSIGKNFSLAIGGRANCLCSFADISRQYGKQIYIEAYQAIKSIIDKPDLIDFGGIAAKQKFESVLKRIESLFKNKKELIKISEYVKYDSTQFSDFEKFYIDFCAKEKLFLNFHIHQEDCEAAITDPIFINEVITPIEDDETFYNLARYINQIKEDYAVARLLLAQSQYKREDFDRIGKRTTFVYCLDYSKFNLYVGLLKSSFKESYNILDKIAVFINTYCNLGLEEDKIYFISIWEKKKNEKIRDELLKYKNISLYALYDIFLDFKSGYYKKIQNIRNTLTHRKLVIYDYSLSEVDEKDNIGYYAMLNETIELLRLTKSAIIYLINFVNNNENRKTKAGPTLPGYVDTSQFL